MNPRKLFLVYLISYFLIRVFSFYFAPGSTVNTVVSVTVIMIAAYGLIKQNDLTTILAASELLLGGSGTFFQISSLSVRTILLGMIVTCYTVRHPAKIFRIKPINLLIFSLVGFGAIGALNGYLNGNSIKLIFSDFIPYLFLFYFFPLKALIRKESWLKTVMPAVWAAIAGGFGFILWTFAGFASGNFVMQDAYYHWFRDIAGGKITFVEYNFYRLVLNEHLMLAPAFVLCFYETWRKNSKLYFFLGILLLTVLAINLTRIYFLAIVAGLLILISKTDFKNWIKNSIIFGAIFLSIFSGMFLLSSGGKSLGLEVFGLRLQSIVMPNIENSSLSRLLLLPEIIKIITANPILGKGLGSTVSVFSPVFNQIVTTPHFDWGYLEILAELGLLGFISWLAFIIFAALKLKKQSKLLLSILVSLLVINITSPAIFHVFGIIIIVLLTARSENILKAPSSSPPHTA